MYNYRYEGINTQVGPFINRSNIVGSEQGLTKSLKSSNTYYLLGKSLTGKITKKINLEENIRLSVVVR